MSKSPLVKDKSKANLSIDEELGEPRVFSYVLVELFPSRQELFDLIDRFNEVNNLPKDYKGYNKGNSIQLQFANSVRIVFNRRIFHTNLLSI